MTSQTKHYVEIADLLSLLCDCKKCGTSLSVALREDSIRSLSACPSCNTVWVQGVNEKELMAFLRQIEHMKILAGTMGFNLFLEVSGPASSGKD